MLFSLVNILIIIVSIHFLLTSEMVLGKIMKNIPNSAFSQSNNELNGISCERDQKKTRIFIHTKLLYLCIADDESSRRRGLSGTIHIPDNEGMLFIFDQEGRHGFWMKDMLIPIDIVWIDADRRVVDILDNVATSTYPEIFSSEENIKYVLELGAGNAERIGIRKGLRIDF